MAREDLHFRLRIPEDLKARIERQAATNRRSMTAEIVAALETVYPPPPMPLDLDLTDQIALLKAALLKPGPHKEIEEMLKASIELQEAIEALHKLDGERGSTSIVVRGGRRDRKSGQK